MPHSLVYGADLAENWSIREKVVVIWLCSLTGFPCICLGVSTEAGHLCSSQSAAKAWAWTAWAIHFTFVSVTDDGLWRKAMHLYPSSLCWCSRLSQPSVMMINYRMVVALCVLVGQASAGLVSRIRSVRWDIWICYSWYREGSRSVKLRFFSQWSTLVVCHWATSLL